MSELIQPHAAAELLPLPAANQLDIDLLSELPAFCLYKLFMEPLHPLYLGKRKFYV